MSLARIEPSYRALEDFARFFGPRLGTRTDGGDGDWIPAVDVEESDHEYLVKAELPEVSPSGVKITVENGVLTLAGERRSEKEDKSRKYHRTERFYGSFVRSFSIPTDTEESKIAAEFKDGMLYVHMPKGEKAKPKQIEVKVS